VAQVLVGAALGLAWLVPFAWAVGPAARYWRGLAAGARLALIVAAIPVLWSIWPNGQSPDQAIAVLLLLGGWWAGIMLDRRVAPTAAIPRIWQHRLVAAVAGIGVLFALRTATVELGTALAIGKSGIGWMTAALIGFYATGVAPAGFLVAGLSRRQPVPAD
jgi:hypothetical protein